MRVSVGRLVTRRQLGLSEAVAPYLKDGLDQLSCLDDNPLIVHLLHARNGGLIPDCISGFMQTKPGMSPPSSA
jgi:hypothetical protein